MGQGEVWELRIGDTILGKLVVKERDHSWTSCHFEPFTAFEEYRHYWYPNEMDSLSLDERFNTWATQIQSLNLLLVNIVDKRTKIPRILHINVNENRASFR